MLASAPQPEPASFSAGFSGLQFACSLGEMLSVGQRTIQGHSEVSRAWIMSGPLAISGDVKLAEAIDIL